MIYHIFCSSSAVGSAKYFLKNRSRSNEHVILFDDNFSFGPLSNFLSDEGKMLRNNWRLKNVHDILDVVYTFSEDVHEEADDYEFHVYKKFELQIQKISKDDKVFVYVDNEVASFLFLGYLYNILQHSNIYVYVCYDGEHTLGATHYDKYEHILGKGEIFSQGRQDYFAEYFRNISENSLLRIWKNELIEEIPFSYFDSVIKEQFLKNKWVHLWEIAGHFICSRKYHEYGEIFLYIRLFALVEKGEIAHKTQEIKIPAFGNTSARKKKIHFFKK